MYQEMFGGRNNYDEQDLSKEARETGAIEVSEAVPKYEPQRETGPVEGRYYTYADYCAWDDGKRWELIDGVAYAMGAPSLPHARVSRELFKQLVNWLTGRPCEVFVAPFDVRLNADAADDTVVQPDILVVCDDAKLNKAGCAGAPDFAIEILSPSSIQHDRLRKLHLYEKSGVREYWIVSPENRQVDVYILENGKYVVKNYDGADTVPVHALKGCEIDLRDVFARLG